MKRFLSLAIAACIVLSSAVTTVFAAEDETPKTQAGWTKISEIEFSVTDGKISGINDQATSKGYKVSCENGAVTVERVTATESGNVRIPFTELELGEKYYIEFEYKSEFNADTSEVTNVTGYIGGYSSFDRYNFRHTGVGFWRTGAGKKVSYAAGANSEWHTIGTEIDMTNQAFNNSSDRIIKHYFDGKPLFSGDSFLAGYAYNKINKNQIIFGFDINEFVAGEKFSFRNFGIWKYDASGDKLQSALDSLTYDVILNGQSKDAVGAGLNLPKSAAGGDVKISWDANPTGIVNVERLPLWLIWRGTERILYVCG